MTLAQPTQLQLQVEKNPKNNGDKPILINLPENFTNASKKRRSTTQNVSLPINWSHDAFEVQGLASPSGISPEDIVVSGPCVLLKVNNRDKTFKLKTEDDVGSVLVQQVQGSTEKESFERYSKAFSTIGTSIVYGKEDSRFTVAFLEVEATPAVPDSSSSARERTKRQRLSSSDISDSKSTSNEGKKKGRKRKSSVDSSTSQTHVNKKPKQVKDVAETTSSVMHDEKDTKSTRAQTTPTESVSHQSNRNNSSRNGYTALSPSTRTKKVNAKPKTITSHPLAPSTEARLSLANEAVFQLQQHNASYKKSIVAHNNPPRPSVGTHEPSLGNEEAEKSSKLSWFAITFIVVCFVVVFGVNQGVLTRMQHRMNKADWKQMEFGESTDSFKEVLSVSKDLTSEKPLEEGIPKDVGGETTSSTISSSDQQDSTGGEAPNADQSSATDEVAEDDDDVSNDSTISGITPQLSNDEHVAPIEEHEPSVDDVAVDSEPVQDAVQIVEDQEPIVDELDQPTSSLLKVQEEIIVEVVNSTQTQEEVVQQTEQVEVAQQTEQVEVAQQTEQVDEAKVDETGLSSAIDEVGTSDSLNDSKIPCSCHATLSKVEFPAKHHVREEQAAQDSSKWLLERESGKQGNCFWLPVDLFTSVKVSLNLSPMPEHCRRHEGDFCSKLELDMLLRSKGDGSVSDLTEVNLGHVHVADQNGHPLSTTAVIKAGLHKYELRDKGEATWSATEETREILLEFTGLTKPRNKGTHEYELCARGLRFEG